MRVLPVHRVSEIAGESPAGGPPWSGWGTVAPLGGLSRSESGASPRQPTAVRIARGDAGFLVRFDAIDAEPWSTFDRRDAPLWEEEVVEVFLAPGEEAPARYHEFEVNPGGAVFDARVDNPDSSRATMRVDPSWDCPGLRWAAGGTPDGWWAELWIPTAPLLDGAIDTGVWRANFYRIDRPRSGEAEFTAWSPTFVAPPDFHLPRRFGFLRTEDAWTHARTRP